MGDEHRPPERWGEPIVQRYLKNFVKLMETPRHKLIYNPAVESDFVYSHIMNIDAKRRIEERKMTEREYLYITACLMRDLPQLPQAATKALTLSQRGVGIYQPDNYLNQLNDGILAVESGLKHRTVDKYLQKGFTGSQIVDAGSTMEYNRTTGQVARKLIASGITGWQEVIEISRDTGCSVAILLKIMDQIGTKDADDIVGLVDECHNSVVRYSEKKHVPVWKAWGILFVIYTKNGNGDVTQTLDIYNGDEGIIYDKGEIGDEDA